MLRAWPCVFLLFLAACGGSSPSAPSGSSASETLQGQTLNAISGTPATGLSVVIGSYRPVTTDDNGLFAIDGARSGSYAAIVRGSSVVERETTITTATEPTMVSMIPASFDLVAFDEMFRYENSRLQRWTTRPSLIVVATTMTFRSTADTEFQATTEQMSDDEVAQMRAHLTDALALLTGGTFMSFQDVTIERPKAGEWVSGLRAGAIVVGRYTGIVSLANTIGYGRWSETTDGRIVGGAMFLDRDFDRDDARRRLLRTHELGHALGWQHVRSRVSIMNPVIGSEPTDFDRAGAIIAFKRPPGNHAPDVDPSGGTRTWSTTGEGARWSRPTVCQ
jgi:hypothetical protein